MSAYYNDHDPFACDWLRQLIRAGQIPDGEVDDRSITDVDVADLRGFTACHFFAGIGGWAYALRLAGWPDDRPVWTGSPPCQPFSAAGQRKGRDDARHLAPHFLGLVRAGRPPVLFGEQVASSEVVGSAGAGAGREASSAPEWAWLDDLCDGLEAAGYAAGAADIPAAGVGAPHIRQRLFFGAIRLADAERGATKRHGQQMAEPPGSNPGGEEERQRLRHDARHGNATGGLENSGGQRRDGEPIRLRGRGQGQAGFETAGGSPIDRLADADSAGRRQAGRNARSNREADAGWPGDRASHDSPDGVGRWLDGPPGPGPSNGPWGTVDWLHCRDGKWRPVEPGTFPLADGLPGRVGRLRGYGNAIVPQAAAEFVMAFMEAVE